MLLKQLQLKKKGKFSYDSFIFVTIISDLYNDDNKKLNVTFFLRFPILMSLLLLEMYHQP